jgi:glycosyltransferase involved in cell wall biosynthesis
MMNPGSIAAVLACRNNAVTLPRVLQAIINQTIRCDLRILIDDGSSDGSGEVAESWGFRTIRLEPSQGRGAARRRGMEEARAEWVLWCDGTIVLPNDFVEKALAHFQHGKVAAVQGRLVDPHPLGAVARWRARHLYKQHLPWQVRHDALLATTACVVRSSAVLEAGSFNAALRHSEDGDLGHRLLARGHEVIMDPELHLDCVKPPRIGETLERYWRWHAGADEKAGLAAYLKNIKYSLTVMARQDLREKDLASAGISLLCPHYQFWKSLSRQLFRDRTPQ